MICVAYLCYFCYFKAVRANVYVGHLKLSQTPQISRSHATRAAQVVRNDTMQFFQTPGGAVEWQDEIVSRGSVLVTDGRGNGFGRTVFDLYFSDGCGC